MKSLTNLFSYLKAPLILSILFIIVLSYVNSDRTEDFIWGVALGVVLTFIANITKDSFDEWLENEKLKNISLELLEQDAIQVETRMRIFSDLFKNKSLPQEVKESLHTTLPTFKFGLKYWKILSKKEKFLYLGTESPFKEIFKDFHYLDYRNTAIDLSEGNVIAQLANFEAYKSDVKKEFSKKLLKKFK